MREEKPLIWRQHAWLFWVFACLLGVYLLSAGGHLTASDDEQKLRALEALWLRHDTAIVGGWAPGPDGRLYSWFPIGSSLLMAPAFILSQALGAFLPGGMQEAALRFLVALQNAPIVAALGASLAWLAWRLGMAPRHAAAGGLAYGLGSMAWPYAKSAWSEPMAALCLLWALVWLWEGVPGGQAPLRGGRIVAAGSALALATTLRLELILLAPGALLWLGWRRAWALHDVGRIVGWLLGPLLFSALLTLAYNAARFGHPLALPAFSNPNAVASKGVAWRLVMGLKNLWAYSFHPGRGLLVFNPLLLGAALGWVALGRAQPALVRLMGWSLLPMALFYCFAWPGSSFAWGPRYFFVFTPFLALGMAWAVAAAGWRRRLALGAFGMGLGVQLWAVTVNPVVVFEEVVQTRPGVNLLHRFDEAAAFPVPLAAAEFGRRWASAWATVMAPPPAGHYSAPSARAGMRWLPDLWPFVLLWSPLPRAAIFGLWGALALWLAFAGAMLWRSLALLGRVQA